MIGAVTYQLAAAAPGRMEGYAGRLLHGAFFQLLQAWSPELAETVHNAVWKPFTVSPLILPEKNRRKEAMLFRKEPFPVQTGESFAWRITALDDTVLEAAARVKPGALIQVGHVPLKVQQVYCDGSHASGILSPEALLETALEAENVQDITLHFVSPVSFRKEEMDYPLPEPALIFGSLAKKWQAAKLPAQIDSGQVADIASRLMVLDWQGKTSRVYFGRKHGMMGFTGFFNYRLQDLTREEAQLIRLLSQLAVFTGVGRLTAQGFGQTRINWK